MTYTERASVYQAIELMAEANEKLHIAIEELRQSLKDEADKMRASLAGSGV